MRKLVLLIIAAFVSLTISAQSFTSKTAHCTYSYPKGFYKKDLVTKAQTIILKLICDNPREMLTINHNKMGMPANKTIWDEDAINGIKKALRTQQGVILLDAKKMTIKTSAGDVKCYRTVADNGMVTIVEYHFMHKGDGISVTCQAFSEDYKASNLTRYDSYAKKITFTK